MKRCLERKDKLELIRIDETIIKIKEISNYKLEYYLKKEILLLISYKVYLKQIKMFKCLLRYMTDIQTTKWHYITECVEKQKKIIEKFCRDLARFNFQKRKTKNENDRS